MLLSQEAPKWCEVHAANQLHINAFHIKALLSKPRQDCLSCHASRAARCRALLCVVSSLPFPPLLYRVHEPYLIMARQTDEPIAFLILLHTEHDIEMSAKLFFALCTDTHATSNSDSIFSSIIL